MIQRIINWLGRWIERHCLAKEIDSINRQSSEW